MFFFLGITSLFVVVFKGFLGWNWFLLLFIVFLIILLFYLFNALPARLSPVTAISNGNIFSLIVAVLFTFLSKSIMNWRGYYDQTNRRLLAQDFISAQIEHFFQQQVKLINWVTNISLFLDLSLCGVIWFLFYSVVNQCKNIREIFKTVDENSSQEDEAIIEIVRANKKYIYLIYLKLAAQVIFLINFDLLKERADLLMAFLFLELIFHCKMGVIQVTNFVAYSANVSLSLKEKLEKFNKLPTKTPKQTNLMNNQVEQASNTCIFIFKNSLNKAIEIFSICFTKLFLLNAFLIFQLDQDHQFQISNYLKSNSENRGSYLDRFLSQCSSETLPDNWMKSLKSERHMDLFQNMLYMYLHQAAKIIKEYLPYYYGATLLFEALTLIAVLVFIQKIRAAK